jgi:hypothetical protein
MPYLLFKRRCICMKQNLNYFRSNQVLIKMCYVAVQGAVTNRRKCMFSVQSDNFSVCVCVCVCVGVCVCVCMHIHIYTNTYIYPNFSNRNY